MGLTLGDETEWSFLFSKNYVLVKMMNIEVAPVIDL